MTTSVSAPGPFHIGPIEIDPPLLLAPMAGQTHHAFRRLCRELGGCGLVCTELISSNALDQKGTRERTMELFDWSPQESPLAVQLFGSDPGVMAEAARIVVDHGADIVDINMGCWVPKVAKKGGGAALLRDLLVASAVVEAVVKAVEVPVTVKVRSGWHDGKDTAVDFAVAAEQLGVAAVTVHARTAEQGFTGEADWSVIGRVKQAVSRIPVIGNGDVTDSAELAQMFLQTGCDGVMIGRAALGRPWIFGHLLQGLQGRQPPEPDLAERARMAIRQAELTLETTPLPEQVALREMRGQLSRYRLDAPGQSQVRDRLVRADSLAEIRAILEPLTLGVRA
ncbi:MAG: tRNA dihydrouridine synthase DusB [Candidatus Eremiobacteraeota bacterium]|nr:tRNA dihydrouridine synthase DusB [Candidatus Eremiobacteraeota bacterium]